MGKEFRLIDRNESAQQIFIKCDDGSESILAEITERLTEKGLRIPVAFHQYSIDLSGKHYDSLGDKIESICDHRERPLFGVINVGRYPEVYSPDTGIKVL